MPRAADAYATADKWGWILGARGHGTERDRAPHGVVGGVELTLTINDREAAVATAWHYPDEDAAPRLVTAYPTA